MRVSPRFLIPTEDGLGGDPEHAGCLVSGEGQEGLEAEDPEAGLRGVVGPLALGEPVPAGGEDVEGLSQEGGVQRLLLELGEAVEDGVAASRGSGEPLGESEAE